MNSLELNINAKSWSDEPSNRLPVLLMSINHIGYYSLPIRILALLSNKTEIIRNKYDVKFAEWELKDDIGGILNCILNWRPDIIGFSVNIWNRDMIFDIIRRVKKKEPKIQVVAGGQEMTNSVTDYLKYFPELDYIIDGEGELPFIQFLDHWDSEQNSLNTPGEVSGLHYRHGNKTIYSGPADTVSSLGEIPSVIIEGLIAPDKVGPLGALLEGARGCPFRCSFCFEALRKSRTVLAPIDRMQNEIEHMVSNGVTLFHIMDPILCNSNSERLKTLSKAIKWISEKYHKKLEISVEVYGDKVNNEIAKWIGCFSVIDVGLQSTNPKTLEAIHRQFHLDKFRKGIKHLKKTGSTINIYLIIGLPYETFRTSLEGVCFAISQQPTKLFLNELVLLNGTELRRRADEFGYHYNPNPPYIVYNNKWLSSVEVSVLNCLAIDIVRRYNLSFDALPQKKPIFKIQRDQKCSSIQVCLKEFCQNPCQAELRGKPEKTSAQVTIDSLYNSANSKNIEFLIDINFPLRKLLHHAAQFQLAGASRMKLYAPILYFSDPQTISKLINSGIWHFMPIICLNDFSKDNQRQTIKSIIRQISHTYTVLGRGQLRPYLGINLYTQGSAINEIQKSINFVRDEADSICLPDIADFLDLFGKADIADLFLDSIGNNERKQKVSDPSMMDVRPDYWLKLPSKAIPPVMDALNIRYMKADLFNDLELSIHEYSKFPCYQHLAKEEKNNG
jgi:radical SAM superfamily enzyme YgiQ (UPF0313 family)